MDRLKCEKNVNISKNNQVFIIIKLTGILTNLNASEKSCLKKVTPVAVTKFKNLILKKLNTLITLEML